MTIRRLKIKGSDITVRALEFPGGKYHITMREWTRAYDKTRGVVGEPLYLQAPDGSQLDVITARDREGAQVGYLCAPVTP